MGEPPIDLNKLPGVLRDALRLQSPDFAQECARAYLDADEPSRADILAFFESDGPRKVHEAKQHIEHGIPTSEEIEGWARG